ncbi:MAG: hypothetical protein ACD_18C00087G0004 [uncultured bacterium]|nr:MAG: hypothetical protein ACD_18C00087G0004 [uncultured bacterium]OGH88227.1 MAG: hypothetical protein A2507_05065 [Candidatus Magasanikbacteria bacterium RIFOXYD12_FULL_33_17]HAO51855.1 hypothetical protein [Candidatus Magasanikbacteria bacterium]
MEQQRKISSEGESLERFRKKLIDEIFFQIRILQAQGNVDTENYDLDSLLNNVKKALTLEELKRIQTQLLNITENRNLR